MRQNLVLNDINPDILFQSGLITSLSAKTTRFSVEAIFLELLSQNSRLLHGNFQ